MPKPITIVVLLTVEDYDRILPIDFNMAIQLKPNLAEAYYNRGITYGFKGDYDLAIEDYNRAIDLGSCQCLL